MFSTTLLRVHGGISLNSRQQLSRLIAAGCTFSASVILGLTYLSAEDANPGAYFDLGTHLVEEFNGTYEFKYKRLEFNRVDAHSWTVMSSGDESQRTDRLVVGRGYLYWFRDGSEESLLAFKMPIHRGKRWQQTFRGIVRHYEVIETDASISLPAGRFEHCAKVLVSWSERAPDMSGPQKAILYLAPGLGIIEREYWSGDTKWHEEVLTKYAGIAK